MNSVHTTPTSQLQQFKTRLDELAQSGTWDAYMEEVHSLFQAFTPDGVLQNEKDNGGVEMLKHFMTTNAPLLRMVLSHLMVYLKLENETSQGIGPLNDLQPAISHFASVRRLQELRDEDITKADIVFHANRFQALAIAEGSPTGSAENEAIKIFVKSLFLA